MAGEVAVDVSSSNGKIKEQCAVVASLCHDLANGGPADCNGVKSEPVAEQIENGNGKEDADRTYVFVNGSDTVDESVDNDENCTKAALAEDSAKNHRELELNGEFEVEEAKVNGCNGHCEFEKVAVIVENGRAMSDENGGRGMEKNSLPVAKDLKGESEELGPVEEVDAVSSNEPKALGVVNSEEIVDVETSSDSFEVVEKVPESLEYHGDPKGSSDCKEPTESPEELLEQVESSSAFVQEVPDSQAVNAEDIDGLSSIKEPAPNISEQPEKVECTSEVVVGLESCSDMDGLVGIVESSKIAKQLPLQLESTLDVVEEVPDPQSVSHVDAACDKESSERGIDLPLQMESASEVVFEEIPESQAVSDGDAEDTGACKELSGDALQKTVELPEQECEDQKSEVIVTDTAAELASGDNKDEPVAGKTEPYSIREEKVVEPSQLSPTADVPGNQESEQVQAEDANNVVEQEKEPLEVAAEFSKLDQMSNVGDHDQVPEPSAYLQPSDVDTSSSQSSIANEQSLESSPVPDPVSDPVSAAEVDGDSVDASLETNKLDTAPGNAEMLVSSAECNNVTVECTECSPTAEETVAVPDADVGERSLTAADDISSPAFDDREPTAEPLVVNEVKAPVLEVEVGNATTATSAEAEVENGVQDPSVVANDISSLAVDDKEPATEFLAVKDGKEPVLEVGNTTSTISGDAEAESGVQDGSVVADEISSPALDDREPAAELGMKESVLEVEVGNAEATTSVVADEESEAQDVSVEANYITASYCATESTEAKICFGSISHEELSSISTEGRIPEAKSAVDPAVPSPDLESPENVGSDKGAEAVDAVPQNDENLPAEGSRVEVLEALPSVPEVEKRFFNYRVRLPRYDGEDLREKINEAQARVEEKTRSRDAIQAEIQMIKATRNGFWVEFEAASAEERSARDMLKSKRQEIDTVQSVVDKVRNAMSIDEIDARIHSMEHRIEHETLPLKEEKQLLREIKQWKQHREQLSSNMGKHDELKEALENKEKTEERLKVLKKELESLRGNVSRADVVTKAAKKKHSDGNEQLQKLQEQFKAADAVRQEAYLQLQSFRKQLYEKNKYFFKYRDDAKISSDLGSKGDRDGVSQFCIKQVEDFMELWNKKAEFRSDYVRCSSRGTLRRLGTKDGRSLGIDEQPPVIPSSPMERVVKDKPSPAFPSLEQSKARASPVGASPSANNVPVKPVEEKQQNSKAKAPAKPSEAAAVSVSSVSVRDVEVAEVTEEPKRTKEEEERARKEEELRKEEEAVRLKEQRRLEEKAKAEAALERKKRNAERAQARAASKAQKEAEQREKEREKRLKKKERKKAVGSEPEDAVNEGEPAPSSPTPTETPKESETREKVNTVVKRLHKPPHFTKQIKVKPTIPPPLRNRGKRKMQPWMWGALGLIALVIILLALISRAYGWQLF